MCYEGGINVSFRDGPSAYIKDGPKYLLRGPEPLVEGALIALTAR
jgi:hypothetical protein